MNAMQRVVTTLQHQEPDRVPVFLLMTMHGAKELGLSIRDYFHSAEAVAEGQLRLRAKYGHDCYYTFFYAPIEVEGWGAEMIWRDDGPPVSGGPLLDDFDAIERLQVPDLDAPGFQRVLETTRLLKAEAGDDVPIVGVVMSPFSLPVMQVGFEGYLLLLMEQPALWQRLMAINEALCIAWANAQLEAGATAICYFDPVSSSTIIPPDLYRRTGNVVARRVLPAIHGPTATHMASGRSSSIIDDLAATGTAALAATVEENLADLKRRTVGRLTLLGNLNGIEMRRWSSAETENCVRAAIAQGGPGGGFILSDCHGEIPWQVPDATLHAIMAAARRWGQYPLTGSQHDN